jgi:hypothetical protein
MLGRNLGVELALAYESEMEQRMEYKLLLEQKMISNITWGRRSIAWGVTKSANWSGNWCWNKSWSWSYRWSKK